jgi:hypothetical protein
LLLGLIWSYSSVTSVIYVASLTFLSPFGNIIYLNMLIFNIFIHSKKKKLWEVIFSRSLSIAGQEDLSRIMGVRRVIGTSTYLGLSSMIGRRKKYTFVYVKDRIWNRINSWRSRPLPKAEKEVMIKSVSQAIPHIL